MCALSFHGPMQTMSAQKSFLLVIGATPVLSSTQHPTLSLLGLWVGAQSERHWPFMARDLCPLDGSTIEDGITPPLSYSLDC